MAAADDVRKQNTAYDRLSVGVDGAERGRRMTVDLDTREDELRGRIAALREEAAAAVLDGGKHDPRALAAAESELEAVEGARALSRRRRVEVATAAAAERAAALRAKMRQAQVNLDAHVEAAEDAARGLVRALAKTEVAAADLRRLVVESGHQSLLGLDPVGFRRWLAAHVAAALRELAPAGRFGNLDLKADSFAPADRWSDGALARELDAITMEPSK